MATEPAKILIIDDEQAICDGCRLALGDGNCEVDVRLAGRAGKDAILAGSYDVVLLDMKLPDLSGLDILRIAREIKPLTQVILITGYSTVQNAVEAMKSGAFDFLTKPFTDEELLLAVNKAVEKKRLIEENIALRSALLDQYSFNNIVGEDPAILKIFEQVERVAPTDSAVMLHGESGTGKELVAGAIHAHSRRAVHQFMALDCSALSPTLLESELFGHVRGAFTGAIRDKEGIFEAAHGGTLFIDDVTNLHLELQGKLLRVLEMGEYKPVGAARIKKADVRIIAATNKNIQAMVEEGDFREDLFYRLNVFPVYIPPLRERKSDIPKLAYHFLRLFCRKTGKRIEGFSDEALEALMTYEWPGNVRQLKNVVERLVIMSDATTLDLFDLLDSIRSGRPWPGDTVPGTLAELKEVRKHLVEGVFDQVQKAFLIKALKACEGNVTSAAVKVGMQRSNFSALLKKHNISAGDIKAQIMKPES